MTAIEFYKSLPLWAQTAITTFFSILIGTVLDDFRNYRIAVKEAKVQHLPKPGFDTGILVDRLIGAFDAAWKTVAITGGISAAVTGGQ